MQWFCIFSMHLIICLRVLKHVYRGCFVTLCIAVWCKKYRIDVLWMYGYNMAWDEIRNCSLLLLVRILLLWFTFWYNVLRRVGYFTGKLITPPCSLSAAVVLRSSHAPSWYQRSAEHRPPTCTVYYAINVIIVLSDTVGYHGYNRTKWDGLETGGNCVYVERPLI